jgi:hypothetical protein
VSQFSYIGLADDSNDLLDAVDLYLKHHRHRIPQNLKMHLYELRDMLNDGIDMWTDLAERGCDSGAAL